MQHVKPEGVADGRQQGGNGNGALGRIGGMVPMQQPQWQNI